jgi:hypothetical protein
MIKKRNNVKLTVLAASVVLAMAAAAPALAIEVVNNPYAAIAAGQSQRTSDVAPVAQAVMLNNAQSSELPEPEVFLMMLLGLVLIGYRASRVNGEKFK